MKGSSASRRHLLERGALLVVSLALVLLVEWGSASGAQSWNRPGEWRGVKRLNHLSWLSAGAEPVRNLLRVPLLLAAPRPDPRIVVVGLDDATLDDPELEQWAPGILRRKEHARLAANLTRGGARVLGFDITFVGESPDDGLLRKALDRAPSTVLAVEVQALGSASDKRRFILPPPALTGSRSVRPASPAVRRTATTGEVIGVEHQQNQEDGRALNSLAFECCNAFTGKDDLQSSLGYKTVSEGMMGILWPLGSAEKPAGFEVLSYRDVWRGGWLKTDRNRFRDKIVLIGSTQKIGRADVLKTPVGAIPGVVVHACALSNLLQGAEPDSGVPLTLAAMAAAWLGTFMAVYLLTPWRALGVMAGLMAAAYAVAILCYSQGTLFVWLHPALVIASVGSVGLVVRGSFARHLLERYAGQEAAGQLERRGRIEARTQRATIFFADVRGYTTLSERLDPAELMSVVNQHYAWVDGIVVKHGGRVDKHIGDAMMAVFEVGKRPGFNPAAAAIAAAEEIVRTAGGRTGPSAELAFGIGIHTGTVTTGGLGSERLETGTLGDAVNVAARLEQATRTAGVDVLISADTARDAGAAERLQPLPPLTLKGKSDRVEAFTLP